MKQAHSWLKDSLLFSGVVISLLVALPILFVVAITLRFVFVACAIAAMIVGTVAYMVSRRFRDWLANLTEGALTYNGLLLPNDVAMHPGHAWVRIKPDSSETGVDDLMQATLGPVDRVELPDPGQRIERDQPLLTIWHAERKVDVRSPVGGTVVAANPALDEQPGLINDHPYGSGWAVRMRCEAPRRETSSLLRGARAQAWFRREVDRLLGEALADPKLSTALPDGGALVQLDRQLDDAAWERVTRTFFGEETPDPDAAAMGRAPEHS